VPTTYRRLRIEMVGTLRFAYPTDRDLICFARKRNRDARLREINMMGKSLRIFRNRVKPRNQKYSAFVLTQISGTTPFVSRQMRGASRSSRMRGEMRWTLSAR